MGLRESAQTFMTGSAGVSPREAELLDALRGSRYNEQMLMETMGQLEDAVRTDEDWRRMAMNIRHQFTRDGLDDLTDISRAMYLSNPLIQRAVNINTYYTWAQGHQFKAKEDRIQQEVIEVQTSSESNRTELYGHQATILTDVDQIVDGNLFFALFTDGEGDVSVRSIPNEHVREIITSPNDYLQVWFYRRCWSQSEFNLTTGTMEVKSYERLYPDISYQPKRKPESIGGIDVIWDAPVIHQRTGGLKHMQFGIPQTYAALDWARANKKFLEDWHTVVSSLARFAWSASTSGSKSKKLKDRLRRRSGSELSEPSASAESGPPVAGALWADKDDLTPINKQGTTASVGDAKHSRLMVGAAMDLPDTILSGDPQQGNLATAKTLDRPTELGMRARQAMYNDFHARVFRYTIDAKIRRGRLPGKVVRTPDGTVVEPGIDSQVITVFPPILEHDPKETVSAIVSAATLDGKATAGTIPSEEVSKKLMSAIGVEDIEAAIDSLGEEQNSALQAAIGQLSKAIGNQGDPNAPNPNQNGNQGNQPNPAPAA